MIKCPKCGTEMIYAKQNYNNMLKDVEVKKCPKCGDVVIDSDTMNLIVEIMNNRPEREVINEKILRELENMVVVSKLSEIRKSQDIDQKDVAARVGLTPQRYSKIEKYTSNITIDRALRIAYSLGVELNELFKLKPKDQLNEDDKIISDDRVNNEGIKNIEK